MALAATGSLKVKLPFKSDLDYLENCSSADVALSGSVSPYAKAAIWFQVRIFDGNGFAVHSDINDSMDSGRIYTARSYQRERGVGHG